MKLIFSAFFKELYYNGMIAVLLRKFVAEFPTL